MTQETLSSNVGVWGATVNRGNQIKNKESIALVIKGCGKCFETGLFDIPMPRNTNSVLSW